MNKTDLMRQIVPKYVKKKWNECYVYPRKKNRKKTTTKSNGHWWMVVQHPEQKWSRLMLSWSHLPLFRTLIWPWPAWPLTLTLVIFYLYVTCQRNYDFFTSPREFFPGEFWASIRQTDRKWLLTAHCVNRQISMAWQMAEQTCINDAFMSS